MKLKCLRDNVDSIDEGILKLLNKRARVIQDIAHEKAKHKGSIYVPDREKDVYRKIVSKNKGPLSN